METIRIVLDPPRPASANMAADYYLLCCAERDPGPPVVRIYGWERPAITIGYHQSPEEALCLDYLNGTPVARRPTGGRALFHTERELTYAVAGNFAADSQLGLTLHETYLRIAKVIERFYNMAGWKVQIVKTSTAETSGGRSPGTPGCFASFSRYEISCAGEKVAASSQRRMKRAFLQHGAIKLESAPSHPAIYYPDAGGSSRLSPLRADRETYVKCLIGAFATEWQVRPMEKPFADSELSAISDLRSRFEILPDRPKCD